MLLKNHLRSIRKGHNMKREWLALLIMLMYSATLFALDFKTVKTLVAPTSGSFGFTAPALVELEDDGTKDLWIGAMVSYSNGYVRVYPGSGPNSAPLFNTGYTNLSCGGSVLNLSVFT